ncbi:septal ring lytic transglycosylase RlpA family protein [Chitinimonas viridis]|uniref:Endolytic peptidoglycan transglycosylase RlpA n=1 Tax=Chitinimonas viridis TaxID=664880 RepID=A0ABT8BAI5_9NEIS|nr:septal ring lytic transglycosylase RlpA family protein [Chitinimonas viridis]MDN3578621.1 septal ring lytic transglycosylase RlpA family protein [Chitinimonas viridis]
MTIRHLVLCGCLLAAGCASYQPLPPATPSKPAEPARPPVAANPKPALPPAKPEQIPQQYGGYYQDDGPILDVPYDLDALTEPEARPEPLHRYANRPYTVLGKSYTPRKTYGEFSQQGMASWYGKKFHGKRTASGEPYDMFKLTAAHPTLPIPSYARVTSLSNGKSVLVRINDRGPFHKGRVIDLSYAAAYRLGYHNGGSAQVKVEAVAPGETQPAPLPETALLQAVEAAAGTLPVRDERTTAVDPLARLASNLADEPMPAPPIETRAEQRWVQLGAFGTQTTAEAFRDKVTGTLGWLPAPVVENSGAIWRVRVGPFDSRQAAQQAADRIANEADLRPVVMR